jgi:hypothetical protein
VVALTDDLPECGLYKGQVGTVVTLAPSIFEVEFSDEEGRAYASLALEESQLLVLRYEPVDLLSLPAIGVNLNMPFCRAIREVARKGIDLSEEQLNVRTSPRPGYEPGGCEGEALKARP